MSLSSYLKYEEKVTNLLIDKLKSEQGAPRRYGQIMISKSSKNKKLKLCNTVITLIMRIFNQKILKKHLSLLFLFARRTKMDTN